MGPSWRGGLLVAAAWLTASCELVESLNGLTGDAGAIDGAVTSTDGALTGDARAEGGAPADGSSHPDGSAAVDAPEADSIAPTEDAVESLPDGPSSAYRAAVLTDMPLAYWRLGETSGTVAHDETGNGHDGAYVGACQLGVQGALVGDPDPALQLDGASCVVDVGDNFDFAGLVPFTLEAWAKPSVIDGVYRHVVEKMQYTDAGDPFTGTYVFLEQGNTTLGFERWSAATAVLTVESSAASPAGTWSHIVATYDGTNGTLYVNGALAIVSQGTGGVPANGVHMLWGPAFAGVLDEPAVYDHVLTAARVQAHYAAAQ